MGNSDSVGFPVLMLCCPKLTSRRAAGEEKKIGGHRSLLHRVFYMCSHIATYFDPAPVSWQLGGSGILGAAMRAGADRRRSDTSTRTILTAVLTMETARVGGPGGGHKGSLQRAASRGMRR